MSNNNETTARRSDRRMTALMMAAGLAAFATLMFAFPSAFAAATAFDALGKILKLICLGVGAIFTAIGVVRIAIAHANEDGPATQKAAMMIATGIVLLVLGASIQSIVAEFAKLVTI